MQERYKIIKTNRQVWKFCFYGFLKNLKFFEPYLYVYLLGTGVNLFQIGLLFSIREIVVYIFEVPSGVIADFYGRKNVLVICFIFYIISFILFFIGHNFGVMVAAMIFFGLGEAFRSGTHKAMIYTYLEKKDWFAEKTFVYGRTRSFSMLGSAVSALFSIIIILSLPSIRWIFLFCIAPYLMNFFLILSYPSYLNYKQKQKLQLKGFFRLSVKQITRIFSKPSLVRVIMSSSVYSGVFEVVKDYIQPIMIMLIGGTGIILFKELNSDNNINVVLGGLYFCFYMFSSVASGNVYRLNRLKSSIKLMHISFYILALSLVLISALLLPKFLPGVILIFFIMYVLKNARRPLVVDAIGDIMAKNERATVLSIDSQFKSFVVIIIAPLFGLLADKVSVSAAFFVLGIILLIINHSLSVYNLFSSGQMKSHN